MSVISRALEAPVEAVKDRFDFAHLLLQVSEVVALLGCQHVALLDRVIEDARNCERTPVVYY